MRLTVVGCAGSLPTPQSATSCYLLEAEEEAQDGDTRTWRVLLDLGSGALGPLQRYLTWGQLDAVLLSHLHPDHMLDLCGLYVALRYDPSGPGRTGALPVYGPSGTAQRLEDAYGRRDPGAMAQVFEVRTWDDDVAQQLGPFTVTASRVRHVGDAYGLRVSADGAVLTYSGDTDSCPALVELARDADVLLAEASFIEGRDLQRGIHLTGLRAGQTAAQAAVGRLVLTHLPPWTAPDVVLAEARTAYSGPIELAVPGMVLQLGR